MTITVGKQYAIVFDGEMRIARVVDIETRPIGLQTTKTYYRIGVRIKTRFGSRYETMGAESFHCWYLQAVNGFNPDHGTFTEITI